MIDRPSSPLADDEIQRLSALVDSGFKDWQSFHDRYAENQRLIRDQPAGSARWKHLRDFLLRYGKAELANGFTRTRFVEQEREIRSVDEPAEVLKLSDGSLGFVGDFEGALVSSGSAGAVAALGLNVPAVAELLHDCAVPSEPTGAAHVRWGDKQEVLRTEIGDEVVILAFARQAVLFDSVGGIKDLGTELSAWAVSSQATVQLSATQRTQLFDISQAATVRIRPADSALFSRAVDEERRILGVLRRPPEAAIRQGVRHAVWPVLALHMSR